jgi:crotonobetainyl-CoA hydratase
LSGIEYREEGRVARITINRPDVLNALDGEAEAELQRIWEDLERRNDIWVAVLTGAGDRAFCTGADMSAAAVTLTGLEYWAQERPGGFGGIAYRRSLNIPVIAAVNGYALGGGMEMALGCDVMLAAESASFGLPEPRVGRIPLDGGVFQLVRQVPHHLAMGLLLTGRRISASDAARYGLVNEVVPADQLDAAVDRWLEEMLACAPLSLRAIKRMVQGAEQLPVPDAMRMRFPELVKALGSQDAEEGVRAFREKRAPQWRAE